MKLALCLNEKDQLEDVQQAAVFKIYENKENKWVFAESISFSVDDVESMKEIRGRLNELIGKMEDCQGIVAKKISGLFYTAFETSGFEMWEMSGSTEEVLEQFVLEEAKEPEEAVEIFVPVKKDVYALNLIEAMQNDPSATSKNIIIPFLEKGGFDELQVTCSHLPPWFENKLGELGYAYTAEESDGHFVAKIAKK